MINAHIIDERGVHVSTVEVDPMGPQPAGAIYGWIPEAQEGYTRMYVSGAWVQVPDADVPPIPEPTVVYKDFTSLEYLDMFTESEQLAVVNATMTVPQVKLWYDRMLAASFVTYADPRTDAGLQALVTAGLITEARKSEIVSELTAT